MLGSVYPQKIFEPAAPVNPYQLYKRMRHARRNGLIISVVLIIAAAAYSMAVLSPALDDTAKVRNAYLSQYSTTVTVGDAFDNFFGSPKVEGVRGRYAGASRFSGNCTYSGEQVQVRIVFGIYGDTFQGRFGADQRQGGTGADFGRSVLCGLRRDGFVRRDGIQVQNEYKKQVKPYVFLRKKQEQSAELAVVSAESSAERKNCR